MLGVQCAVRGQGLHGACLLPLEDESPANLAGRGSFGHCVNAVDFPPSSTDSAAAPSSPAHGTCPVVLVGAVQTSIEVFDLVWGDAEKGQEQVLSNGLVSRGHVLDIGSEVLSIAALQHQCVVLCTRDMELIVVRYQANLPLPSHLGGSLSSLHSSANDDEAVRLDNMRLFSPGLFPSRQLHWCLIHRTKQLLPPITTHSYIVAAAPSPHSESTLELTHPYAATVVSSKNASSLMGEHNQKRCACCYPLPTPLMTSEPDGRAVHSIFYLGRCHTISFYNNNSNRRHPLPAAEATTPSHSAPPRTAQRQPAKGLPSGRREEADGNFQRAVSFAEPLTESKGVKQRQEALDRAWEGHVNETHDRHKWCWRTDAHHSTSTEGGGSWKPVGECLWRCPPSAYSSSFKKRHQSSGSNTGGQGSSRLPNASSASRHAESGGESRTLQSNTATERADLYRFWCDGLPYDITRGGSVDEDDDVHALYFHQKKYIQSILSRMRDQQRRRRGRSRSSSISLSGMSASHSSSSSSALSTDGSGRTSDSSALDDSTSSISSFDEEDFFELQGQVEEQVIQRWREGAMMDAPDQFFLSRLSMPELEKAKRKLYVRLESYHQRKIDERAALLSQSNAAPPPILLEVLELRRNLLLQPPVVGCFPPHTSAHHIYSSLNPPVSSSARGRHSSSPSPRGRGSSTHAQAPTEVNTEVPLSSPPVQITITSTYIKGRAMRSDNGEVRLDGPQSEPFPLVALSLPREIVEVVPYLATAAEERAAETPHDNLGAHPSVRCGGEEVKEAFDYHITTFGSEAFAIRPRRIALDILGDGSPSAATPSGAPHSIRIPKAAVLFVPKTAAHPRTTQRGVALEDGAEDDPFPWMKDVALWVLMSDGSVAVRTNPFQWDWGSPHRADRGIREEEIGWPVASLPGIPTAFSPTRIIALDNIFPSPPDSSFSSPPSFSAYQTSVTHCHALLLDGLGEGYILDLERGVACCTTFSRRQLLSTGELGASRPEAGRMRKENDAAARGSTGPLMHVSKAPNGKVWATYAKGALQLLAPSIGILEQCTAFNILFGQRDGGCLVRRMGSRVAGQLSSVTVPVRAIYPLFAYSPTLQHGDSSSGSEDCVACRDGLEGSHTHETIRRCVLTAISTASSTTLYAVCEVIVEHVEIALKTALDESKENSTPRRSTDHRDSVSHSNPPPEYASSYLGMDRAKTGVTDSVHFDCNYINPVAREYVDATPTPVPRPSTVSREPPPIHAGGGGATPYIPPAPSVRSRGYAAGADTTTPWSNNVHATRYHPSPLFPHTQGPSLPHPPYFNTAVTPPYPGAGLPSYSETPYHAGSALPPANASPQGYYYPPTQRTATALPSFYPPHLPSPHAYPRQPRHSNIYAQPASQAWTGGVSGAPTPTGDALNTPSYTAPPHSSMKRQSSSHGSWTESASNGVEGGWGAGEQSQSDSAEKDSLLGKPDDHLRVRKGEIKRTREIKRSQQGTSFQVMPVRPSPEDAAGARMNENSKPKNPFTAMSSYRYESEESTLGMAVVPCGGRRSLMVQCTPTRIILLACAGLGETVGNQDNTTGERESRGEIWLDELVTKSEGGDRLADASLNNVTEAVLLPLHSVSCLTARSAMALAESHSVFITVLASRAGLFVVASCVAVAGKGPDGGAHYQHKETRCLWELPQGRVPYEAEEGVKAAPQQEWLHDVSGGTEEELRSVSAFFRGSGKESPTASAIHIVVVRWGGAVDNFTLCFSDSLVETEGENTLLRSLQLVEAYRLVANATPVRFRCGADDVGAPYFPDRVVKVAPVSPFTSRPRTVRWVIYHADYRLSWLSCCPARQAGESGEMRSPWMWQWTRATRPAAPSACLEALPAASSAWEIPEATWADSSADHKLPRGSSAASAAHRRSYKGFHGALSLPPREGGGLQLYHLGDGSKLPVCECAVTTLAAAAAENGAVASAAALNAPWDCLSVWTLPGGMAKERHEDSVPQQWVLCSHGGTLVVGAVSPSLARDILQGCSEEKDEAVSCSKGRKRSHASCSHSHSSMVSPYAAQISVRVSREVHIPSVFEAARAEALVSCAGSAKEPSSSARKETNIPHNYEWISPRALELGPHFILLCVEYLPATKLLLAVFDRGCSDGKSDALPGLLAILDPDGFRLQEVLELPAEETAVTVKLVPSASENAAPGSDTSDLLLVATAPLHPVSSDPPCGGDATHLYVVMPKPLRIVCDAGQIPGTKNLRNPSRLFTPRPPTRTSSAAGREVRSACSNTMAGGPKAMAAGCGAAEGQYGITDMCVGVWPSHHTPLHVVGAIAGVTLSLYRLCDAQLSFMTSMSFSDLLTSVAMSFPYVCVSMGDRNVVVELDAGEPDDDPDGSGGHLDIDKKHLAVSSADAEEKRNADKPLRICRLRLHKQSLEPIRLGAEIHSQIPLLPSAVLQYHQRMDGGHSSLPQLFPHHRFAQVDTAGNLYIRRINQPQRRQKDTGSSDQRDGGDGDEGEHHVIGLEGCVSLSLLSACRLPSEPTKVVALSSVEDTGGLPEVPREVAGAPPTPPRPGPTTMHSSTSPWWWSPVELSVPRRLRWCERDVWLPSSAPSALITKSGERIVTAEEEAAPIFQQCLFFPCRDGSLYTAVSLPYALGPLLTRVEGALSQRYSTDVVLEDDDVTGVSCLEVEDSGVEEMLRGQRISITAEGGGQSRAFAFRLVTHLQPFSSRCGLRQLYGSSPPHYRSIHKYGVVFMDVIREIFRLYFCAFGLTRCVRSVDFLMDANLPKRDGKSAGSRIVVDSLVPQGLSSAPLLATQVHKAAGITTTMTVRDLVVERDQGEITAGSSGVPAGVCRRPVSRKNMRVSGAAPSCGLCASCGELQESLVVAAAIGEKSRLLLKKVQAQLLDETLGEMSLSGLQKALYLV